MILNEAMGSGLAVKLYEIGRLTSGQAAELAGMSRVALLLNCARYGAETVKWDQEELEAEFSDVPAIATTASAESGARRPAIGSFPSGRTGH